MKKITLLFCLICITWSINVLAQYKAEPWSVGVDINRVDFTAYYLSNSDKIKKAADNMQGEMFPTRFTIGRYINSSFNIGLAFASINLDKKKFERGTPINNPIVTKKFWTTNGEIQYKFANGYILNKESWFDPYLILGCGMYNLNNITSFNDEGGLGVNIWVFKKLGINLQGTYNDTWYREGFFSYSGGIKFRFSMVRDMDKDGVSNRHDECPNDPGTIKNNGCPDTDGDGIINKYDDCPDQPGLLKFKGCPDKDNDGIPDKIDECPDQPGLAKYNGCPDRDGDGIIDKLDSCPDQAGLPQFNGCPDTDGDGIPDNIDDCPTIAGTSAFKGCPDTDTDHDGIPDSKDKCPNEPGLQINGGCPDSDGDGIIDKEDECPNVLGKVEFRGCPDSDNDGVPDKEDECPNIAGSKNNKGCPEITASEKSTIEKVARSISFASGSDKIKSNYLAMLDEVVAILKSKKNIKLIIEGHTDNIGKPEANRKLSQKRAESIKNFLILKGIESSRMTAIGYGDANPKLPNNTVKGRSENRRVEFKISY